MRRKNEGRRMAEDPIYQFEISRLIPIEIGGLDFSFTNSSVFMVATVAAAGGCRGVPACGLMRLPPAGA